MAMQRGIRSVEGIDMGIRKISLGLAAAALLGVSPAMAAAPVTPSVASITLAPAAGSALGTRQGAIKSRNSSNVTGGAAVIGVLAVAAAVGGVVAATSGGHGSVSP